MLQVPLMIYRILCIKTLIMGQNIFLWQLCNFAPHHHPCFTLPIPVLKCAVQFSGDFHLALETIAEAAVEQDFTLLTKI